MLGEYRKIVEAYKSMSNPLSDLDKEYFSAYESDDKMRMLELVAEAAAIKMPNTKVVDSDGRPLSVYHGTNHFNAFNRFDLSAKNRHRMEHVPVGTAWFTSSLENALGYADNARIYCVYLNLVNPAIADAKGSYFKDEEFGMGKSGVAGGFETGIFVRRAQRAGKDGAIIRNIVDNADSEDVVADDYIAFSPRQIKLADYATFDDNGQIIPLSKRFNFNKADMRY